MDSADRDDNSHILAISISENEGLSWTHQRILEYSHDGMHLYPTALQDPTCDNVYLAYSEATNVVDNDRGCDILDNVEDYNECLEKSVTMKFIKFTVLHESWIIDDHDWNYDYE